MVEKLRPRLRTFRDGEGRELFDLPDGPLPDPETPAPPRFLPTYDNLVLSHKDRSRILGEQAKWSVGPNQFDEVFTGGFFLVDGFVSGGWRLRREPDGKTASLVLKPVKSLSAADRAALEAEALALVVFLAADAPTREVKVEAARPG